MRSSLRSMAIGLTIASMFVTNLDLDVLLFLMALVLFGLAKLGE